LTDTPERKEKRREEDGGEERKAEQNESKAYKGKKKD